MTRYCGGKKKIAKEIYQVMKEIEEDNYSHELDYFEPFCGMMSVGLEFAKDVQQKESSRRIIVCDANENIISMWKEIQKGWTPPEYVTEEEYMDIKDSSSDNKLSRKQKATIGYVGSAFSFGGTMLGMYRGRYQSKEKTKSEGKSTKARIMAIKPLLKHIEIEDAESYENFSPEGLLIYCDPPYNYKGTKTSHGNKYLRTFDHEKFWKTMKEWSKNNLVFISEVQGNAPKEFKCIWKKRITRSVNSTSRGKKVECLYVHKSYCN